MKQRHSTTDLPPEVREAFVSSTVTALQELAQLEAEADGAAAHDVAFAETGVIAVVRLLRPSPGTMTLILPADVARSIAARYLPSGTELTDEIVGDVAGELANVIAGQTKTMLKGTPYHFALSIPTVSRRERVEGLLGETIAFAIETGRFIVLIDLVPCAGA
jgi:CheY-specific phosphatase CheX